MDPDQVKAAIDALKNNDAAAALTILEALIVSAAGGGGSIPPPADPLAQMSDPPKPEEAVAALTSLRMLSGHVNLGEAIALVTKWKSDTDVTATQAAALELSSRIGLVSSLVKLGVETPATAWEGDPTALKPKGFLATMPITDLRARVTALSGAKPTVLKPPVRGAVELATLSAADAAAVQKKGMTPEQFITAKKNAVKRA